jgi:hypothetical protein
MQSQIVASRSQNRGSLRRGGWQKGCLIAFVVVLVLAIGLAVTAALTWRRIMAASVAMGVTQIVSTSQLPQDQKDRILVKVGTVTDDFRAGKVSLKQFGEAFESVLDGPLMPLAVMMGVQERYFKTSGLSDQDKAEAHKAIQRFAHAVAAGKLKTSDLMKSMDVLSAKSSSTTTTVTTDGTTTTTNNSQLRLKAKVTDEELRAFIADVKAKADKAEIAEDVSEVNIAEEIEKSIDAGLAKGK